MISYSEAFALIEKEFAELNIGTEITPLELAVNRTIAEDIAADVNLPSFDNSAVDGVAIKFSEKIASWKIVGEISAGNFKEYSLRENEAVRIMTGARIPESCDAVIPLEDYDVEGTISRLKSGVKIKRRMNIRPKASDISKGEIAVSKNTFLNARNIAALAACGRTEVKVLKKLKCAVLATGDELVPVNAKPEGDKIRASNHFGLTAAVESVFQTGINYGFVNDNYVEVKEKIEETLNSEADLIITTGGVSVGKYDFVKEIFANLGVEEIFWRAYIKPGKPAYFGKLQKSGKKKLVFGLAGNPVSCMVNFDVYIKPNIVRKYGMPSLNRIEAELLNDVRKHDGKRHFVRGTVSKNNEKYFVSSQISQSSGNLARFSQSNCLIELDEDARNPRKGDNVKCILI
ncbi:MAG: molybdopterin molybdotransferase MoeA [Chlorobi bacterium]|nr:molybdopterin molybdotransferase MoeA [Chlorobiota bacterium]